MAETAAHKRHSLAGKIPTPKPAPSSASPTLHTLADPTEALGKAIGARIRLTTAAVLPQQQQQTLEGTLETADPVLNLVFISVRSSSSSAQSGSDYHVVPVPQINSFQILSLGNQTWGGREGGEEGSVPIGPVDIARLRKREAERVQKLKEQERDRGKGVTSEGQAIFDALKRINTPVRWHNQEIIAHDVVIISAPYRPEDCRCQSGAGEALLRVKRVLEGERKKLRDREERERNLAAAASSTSTAGAGVATPTGPRKGG